MGFDPAASDAFHLFADHPSPDLISLGYNFLGFYQCTQSIIADVERYNFRQGLLDHNNTTLLFHYGAAGELFIIYFS